MNIAPPPPTTIGPLPLHDFPAPHTGLVLGAGLLASYATDWLGADSVRRFRTRSVRPLSPGDTLTCSARVLQTYLRDGEPHVDLALIGTDRHGATVVQAWATFICPPVDSRDERPDEVCSAVKAPAGALPIGAA